MIGLGRDPYGAGRRRRLEPDGDVDAVAEHLILIDDDIAHVRAKPELHDPHGWQMSITFSHQRLHRHRGFDRTDDAREFQQKAIAGILHHPAAMIENDRVDGAAMSLERGMRTGLVRAHHARVTGHVGADNG